jgi:hypothetical protein
MLPRSIFIGRKDCASTKHKKYREFHGASFSHGALFLKMEKSHPVAWQE